MRKPKYRSNNSGFTFIEVMITIGIILVLAAGVTVIVTKSRASANQSKCEANLKNIAVGLQAYYSEQEVFPEDGYPFDGNDPNPLSTELANYVRDKSLFICPEDKDQTSTSNFASYDPYYVVRIGFNQEDDLVIGCPRHKEAKKASSLFYSNIAKTSNIGTVLANGQEIPPDGTTTQRTISNKDDIMTFADGSTVTITDTQAGHGTFLVQSFQLADGTLYSVVRVENDGEIDVQVSSGSKFEIITPSAIVGVRGTRFLVETQNLGYTTKITLINGTIDMKDRSTGNITTLATGGITEYTVVVEPPSSVTSDQDGDGYTLADGDCDDTRASVYPGASDVLNNGIDEDCDGSDLTGTQQLADLLNDTSLSSSDLKNSLQNEYPLSSGVLNQLIDRNPPMDISDLKNILIDHSPLSASVLNNVGNSGMNSSDMMSVFRDNYPLPDSVLNRIISGDIPLDPGDRQNVLNDYP